MFLNRNSFPIKDRPEGGEDSVVEEAGVHAPVQPLLQEHPLLHLPCRGIYLETYFETSDPCCRYTHFLSPLPPRHQSEKWSETSQFAAEFDIEQQIS